MWHIIIQKEITQKIKIIDGKRISNREYFYQHPVDGEATQVGSALLYSPADDASCAVQYHIQEQSLHHDTSLYITSVCTPVIVCKMKLLVYLYTFTSLMSFEILSTVDRHQNDFLS